MDWIQNHIVELFAIIGALYTIARTIVALTPTPKDDQYLDKIGVLLKTVAKTAGLDLKQGLNIKESPKKLLDEIS